MFNVFCLLLNIKNENEERENRFKDKEEMVLMDLEPKKSGSKGGSNSQAPGNHIENFVRLLIF